MRQMLWGLSHRVGSATQSARGKIAPEAGEEEQTKEPPTSQFQLAPQAALTLSIGLWMPPRDNQLAQCTHTFY
jgi:hypothetical protein